MLLLATAAVLLAAGPAVAQTSRVTGEVVNAFGRPLPGVRAELVNAAVGVSLPRYTDAAGHFAFDNVPRSSSTYYLELHWGDKLVYRARVDFSGAVTDLGRISLN